MFIFELWAIALHPVLSCFWGLFRFDDLEGASMDVLGLQGSVGSVPRCTRTVWISPCWFNPTKRPSLLTQSHLTRPLGPVCVQIHMGRVWGMCATPYTIWGHSATLSLSLLGVLAYMGLIAWHSALASQIALLSGAPTFCLGRCLLWIPTSWLCLGSDPFLVCCQIWLLPSS